MSNKYQAFIFEDYYFSTDTCEVTLKYSFDGVLKLQEKIQWHIDPIKYNPEALDRALFALWLMAGVSYYKAYLPNQIIINKGSLCDAQKKFFDSIYINGLAQFFFTNQIEWAGRINFPTSRAGELSRSVQTRGQGSLLAIGGGKDSIVAAEILKGLAIPFDSWVVNHQKRFLNLSRVIGRPMLGVTRTLDPQLAKLNGVDAYNGHVPITAVIGFIGVVLAILTGKKELVWSIESSTDEPNTTWKGLEVNHEYSKSSMFEADMAEYIHEFIAADLEYFSILRPLSELRIAEIFCKNYFEKYRGLFSSCNVANFKQGETQKLSWCGECPKCAFVFTIFSPFLKKQDLVELFNGKNMFANEALTGTFEQLLGIDGHKPLECVGEIAEARLAIELTKATGQYPELNRFDFPKTNYNYRTWHKSQLPSDLRAKLNSFVNGL